MGEEGGVGRSPSLLQEFGVGGPIRAGDGDRATLEDAAGDGNRATLEDAAGDGDRAALDDASGDGGRATPEDAAGEEFGPTTGGSKSWQVCLKFPVPRFSSLLKFLNLISFPT